MAWHGMAWLGVAWPVMARRRRFAGPPVRRSWPRSTSHPGTHACTHPAHPRTHAPTHPYAHASAKAERSAKAKQVFTKLLGLGETPSLDALNLIGKACAATGDSAYAFEVAEKMTGIGVKLTPSFRSSLVTACARSQRGGQRQQVTCY